MNKNYRSKASIGILLAVSFSHFLNDSIQAVLPSIYPLLKDSYHLSFGQVGLITLTFQLTASLLQPWVGIYTDRRPLPYSLACGMGLTLVGLILLATAGSFVWILAAAASVGMGSAVFHPEASRIARYASGGRHGLAQSLFQVGGNAGSSVGPLLAAAIVVPRGQPHVAWFTIAAFVGMAVLFRVGHWYRGVLERLATQAQRPKPALAKGLPRGKVTLAIGILMALVFSKYFYLASLTSYYTFYLIHKFEVSIQTSQVFLFLFLFSVAAGTIIGGPVGDRFGRKRVIWASILGVAPFTLALPHVNLLWTGILSVLIGVILASAFSAILVYAQELLPGRVGLVAGLFFGFAFGMGGIGSAVLGSLADHTSIDFVFHICAYLPLMGLITGFLPGVERAAPPVSWESSKP